MFIQLHRISAAFTVLLTLSIAPAYAASYSEAEEDPETSSNDILSNAEIIAPSFFTAPEPEEVFPRQNSLTATILGTTGQTCGDIDCDTISDVDVDFFRFSTVGNRQNIALFDIDGINDPYTDTILVLFDSAGKVIAYSDDMPETAVDTGSIDEFDSFIGEITLKPGNYLIAVTQFPNELDITACDVDSLTRPDGQPGGDTCTGNSPDFSLPGYTGVGDEGSYRLNISLKQVAEDLTCFPARAADGKTAIVCF